MKALQKSLEIIPALAFLVSYIYTSDIITATAVIIATGSAAFILHFLIFRHVTRMQAIVFVAILLFGLPTVLLNDPHFIKWKATVINILISLIIIVCQFGFKVNPFAFIFGKEFRLPDHLWARMSAAWAVYFLFNAFVNYIVAFRLPDFLDITEQYAELLWVNYKSYGNGLINFLFALCCGLYLYRKHPEAFAQLMKSK